MNFSPRPFTDTNIYVARAASFVSPSSLRERIARFYRRYVELFSGNLVNAGHARLALRVHYRPIPSICQRLENALNCFLPPSLSLNRCAAAATATTAATPRIFKADRTKRRNESEEKERQQEGGLRYRADPRGGSHVARISW